MEAMTLEQVVRFLLGEAELDGVWFGEKPEGERGNFWWRKHLRQSYSAHLTQPAQAVDAGADVEVALSVIDRSIRTLRNAGYPVHADDLLEVRAPVARHLARLVDVERVREAIGYLQSFRNTTPPNWDHTDYAASLLTRALSGEKAGPVGDGWVFRWHTEGDDSLLLISHPEHGGVGVHKEPTSPRTIPEEMLYLLARDLIPASPTPDKEGA